MVVASHGYAGGDVTPNSSREDAETYARVADEVFVDGDNYGRLSVWHTFSRQLFTLLPACGQSKMNILYKQKWWTLFARS